MPNRREHSILMERCSRLIDFLCLFFLAIAFCPPPEAAAQPYGGVHPEAHGAKCDGITDDSAAFTKLLATLNNIVQGGTITISQGRTCLIGPTGTLNVGRGVTLQGEPSVGQSTTNRPLTKPQIVLAHGATITVGTGGGGSLRNLTIVSEDVNGALSGPATMEELEDHLAKWISNADVGIILNGAFGVVDNVEAIGFNKCLVAKAAPVYVRHFKADCINNVDVSNGGDVDVFDDLYLGNLWSGNLMSHNDIGAAAVATGADGGYTDGDLVTMTSGVDGAVCTSLPTFKLAVSAGVVTEAVPLDRGDCTKVPGNFNDYRPTPVTGGSGIGITLDLRWHQSGTRPGTGLLIHKRCDACMFSHVAVGGPAIGVDLDAESGGLFQTALTDVAIEAGAISDGTSKGLYVRGCVSGVTLKGIYAAGNGNSAEFANDVTAAGCPGKLGSLNVIGLRLGIPATWHNNALLVLGPKSGGQISDLQLAGPGYGAGTSIVVGRDVGGWTLSGVSVNPENGTTKPWIWVDPTSSGAVHFSNIMSLTNTPPSVSACGERAAVLPGANDSRGSIIAGRGAPFACTLIFGLAYPVIPVCTVSTNSHAVSARVMAVHTDSVTFGFSSSFPKGMAYYQCLP